jgi:hypothetical protein
MSDDILLACEKHFHDRGIKKYNTAKPKQSQYRSEKPKNNNNKNTKDANFISLTHIYLAGQFPGLIKALQ